MRGFGRAGLVTALTAALLAAGTVGAAGVTVRTVRNQSLIVTLERGPVRVQSS